MSEIKIRFAKKADSKALASIDNAWRKEAISPGFIPRTEQRFADAIKKDVVIVVEKKGKVFGYALGTVKKARKQHLNIDQDVLHINDFGKDAIYTDVDSLYVLKDYRRKGIGKALMRKLMNEVKRRGIKHILLAADNKENPEGLIDLYKSLGFKIVVTYLKKSYPKT